MTTLKIKRALVLAAGFGARMRPLTDRRPKPLVKLDGKPMIDHVLDRLKDAGVEHAIVNVHYLPEMIEHHLRRRNSPETSISDERDRILDTGGAVIKARALLGNDAFFVHNSDSVWIEKNGSTLDRMVETWDDRKMDALLLLAPAAGSLGYSGRGDYHYNEDGAIRRRKGDETADYVFAGVSINHPRLFADSPKGPFSLLRVWDKALSDGRLAAIAHQGLWMHVGTPEALADAEKRIAERKAA
ncbi:MAG: nucleotidyltransferase family protein [Hyphomicrobiales bacterium]|nr:nucleotidyltransferase family protein [Hyphomicrobiales bacterium]